MIREATVHVTGIVQGVGFRPFVYRIAKKIGLTGYVLNLGDAGVRIVLQGEENTINDFLSTMQSNLPSISVIESMEVDWTEPEKPYESFEIFKSSKERNKDAIPILPPDIAMCDDCITDLHDPASRWYGYPFTSCAACGPRFSTITDLPYDRPNTTMVDFPLCDMCNTGYTDPLDRRYHAQTTACETCGPHYDLLTSHGAGVSTANPIEAASELLKRLAIVAVQGIAGTHICTVTSNAKPIKALRQRKNRLQRPFAIMIPNLEILDGFAEASGFEKNLLQSWRRPIVLVRRSDVSSVIPDSSLDVIAPGLDTIGVMLPYAPIHHLLFKHTGEAALVMTSANPSGIPMYINRDRIVHELGGIVDYSLVHNRVIQQRADDSVIKMVSQGKPVFIRRGRGYVPDPLLFEGRWKKLAIVGVGPEEKATASIHSNNRIYPTQHIGDTNVVESIEFLKQAIDHMLHLLDVKHPDAIACDLHPEFLSTELAEKMAATHDVRLYRVPHHHAHLAALAVDHQVEAHTSIVCITADGYGYGTDSSGWGGEVLVGTMRQSQRRGGLMSQRYSGGNLSARFASRALYGILGDQMSGQDFLREVGETCIAEGILLTAESLDVISSSTRRKIGTLESSSAGRFLDAAAALLGICSENSYDAECPMKLEAAARETDLIIEPSFLGSSYGAVLDTTDSLMKLRELKHSGHNTADLAYAIQYHLGFSLADIACDVAESEGIDVVGFSGGVALNRILTQAIRKTVQNRGMTCLIHRSVPPGDGGVSVGQVATAAAQEVL